MSESEPFERKDTAWPSVLEHHTLDTCQDKDVDPAGSHDFEDHCEKKRTVALKGAAAASRRYQGMRDAKAAD